MSTQDIKYFNLQTLADEVVTNPTPESCKEIVQLLSGLPLWSSFINTSPKPEQKRALALLNEKLASPTAEEILFMAEICCGKFHRIRWDRDSNFGNFDSEKAESYYEQYYGLTGSDKVKYILDNFESFKKLCLRSLSKRQRHDELEPYKQNSSPSTSRDPDSEEWKK